jgi:hypothetical protein
MTAVRVPILVDDWLIRSAPGLVTATPGVYLRRVRDADVDERSNPGPWSWVVTLRCGLAVVSPSWQLSKPAAAALAAALGGFSVDWTGDVEAMRRVERSPYGRGHLRPWLLDTLRSLTGQQGLDATRHADRCASCPSCPSLVGGRL